MARFILSARLKLVPPQNLGVIVGNIRRQLQSVQASIQIAIPPQSYQQLKNVNKNLAQTKKAATEASSGVKSLGEAAAFAAKRFIAYNIAAVGIIKLAGSIKQGVTEAIAFERQMNKIAQATGSSAKTVRSVSTEISRLATTFGVSSSKMAEASLTLAQAGLSAKETAKALQALAKTELAPTFDDIVDTTEGAIAIFQQFGVSADSLESTLSSLNSVAAKFAVESSDIITAVRRTGGAFASAGGSLNELMALFTSVRQTTRESAESIATGFRTIFTRMQRMRTQNFLKTMGIDLRDVENQFVGPYEAVRRLSTALKDLPGTDPRFAQIIEELGGFRQVSKVIPLIQQFGVAEKALGVAMSGTTSLSEDANRAQESLAIQIQKTREQFASMVRTLTDSKSFKSVVTIALNLANAFTKVVESLTPLLPMLTTLVAFKLGQAMKPFAKGWAAKGGIGISGMASGGLVPGTGNQDTVPAMLTPGEYVLRKDAVRALGFNRGGKIQKFAGGSGGRFVPRGGPENILFGMGNDPSAIKGLMANRYNMRFIQKLLKQQGFGNIPVDKLVSLVQVTDLPWNRKEKSGTFGLFNPWARSMHFAKSHFDPSTLSHEYGHAMDDFFLRSSGFAGVMAEEETADLFSKIFNKSISKRDRSLYPKDYKTARSEGVAQTFSILGSKNPLLSRDKDVQTGIDYLRGIMIPNVQKKIASGKSVFDIMDLNDIKQMRGIFGNIVASGSKRFAGGGNVPALLTPGEMVVDAGTASQIGLPMLNSMNYTDRFAKGGIIGGPPWHYKHPAIDLKNVGSSFGNVGHAKQKIQRRIEFLMQKKKLDILSPYESKELLGLQARLQYIASNRSPRFPKFLDKLVSGNVPERVKKYFKTSFSDLTHTPLKSMGSVRFNRKFGFAGGGSVRDFYSPSSDLSEEQVLKEVFEGVKVRGVPGYSIEPHYLGNVSYDYAKNIVYRTEDGTAVGALNISLGRSGKPLALSVAVEPEFRRKGIASKLYELARKQWPDIESISGVSGYTKMGSVFARARHKKLGISPKKMAMGGIVPGVGNRDTVSAQLTPGEFVIDKNTTQKLAKGGLVQKFADGGFAGGMNKLVGAGFALSGISMLMSSFQGMSKEVDKITDSFIGLIGQVGMLYLAIQTVSSGFGKYDQKIAESTQILDMSKRRQQELAQDIQTRQVDMSESRARKQYFANRRNRAIKKYGKESEYLQIYDLAGMSPTDPRYQKVQRRQQRYEKAAQRLQKRVSKEKSFLKIKDIGLTGALSQATYVEKTIIDQEKQLAKTRRNQRLGMGLGIGAAVGGTLVSMGGGYLLEQGKAELETGKRGEGKYKTGRVMSQVGSMAGMGAAAGAIAGPWGIAIGAATGALFGFATSLGKVSKEVSNMKMMYDFTQSVEKTGRIFDALERGQTTFAAAQSQVNKFTNDTIKALQSENTTLESRQDILAESRKELDGFNVYLGTAAKGLTSFNQLEGKVGKNLLLLISQLSNMPYYELREQWKKTIDANVKAKKSQDAAIKVQDEYVNRMQNLINIGQAFETAAMNIQKFESSINTLSGFIEGTVSLGQMKNESDILATPEKFFDPQRFAEVLARDITNNPYLKTSFPDLLNPGKDLPSLADAMTKDVQDAANATRMLPNVLINLRDNLGEFNAEQAVDKLVDAFGDASPFVRNAIREAATNIIGGEGQEAKLIEKIRTDFTGSVKELSEGLRQIQEQAAFVSKAMTDETNRRLAFMDRISSLMNKEIELRNRGLDILAQGEELRARAENRPVDLEKLQGLDIQRQRNILGANAGMVNNPAAMGAALQESQRRFQEIGEKIQKAEFKEREKLIQAQSKEREQINSLTQALEFLSNVGDRTAVTMQKVEREQGRINFRTGVGDRAMFAETLGEVRDLANALKAGRVAAETGNIKNIPPKFRGDLRDLLEETKGLGPMGVFGGQSSEQVLEKLRFSFAKSLDMTDEQAREYAKQTSTTLKDLQADLGRQEQLAVDANRILEQGVVENLKLLRQSYDNSIVEFDKIHQTLKQQQADSLKSQVERDVSRRDVLSESANALESVASRLGVSEEKAGTIAKNLPMIKEALGIRDTRSDLSNFINIEKRMLQESRTERTGGISERLIDYESLAVNKNRSRYLNMGAMSKIEKEESERIRRLAGTRVQQTFEDYLFQNRQKAGIDVTTGEAKFNDFIRFIQEGIDTARLEAEKLAIGSEPEKRLMEKGIDANILDKINSDLYNYESEFKKILENKTISDLNREIGNLTGTIIENNRRLGGMTGEPGKHAGGWIYGSGIGDTVPARLAAGEFVLSRKMVKNIGKENVTELARGGKLGSNEERRARRHKIIEDKRTRRLGLREERSRFGKLSDVSSPIASTLGVIGAINTSQPVGINLTGPIAAPTEKETAKIVNRERAKRIAKNGADAQRRIAGMKVGINTTGRELPTEEKMREIQRVRGEQAVKNEISREINVAAFKKAPPTEEQMKDRYNQAQAARKQNLIDKGLLPGEKWEDKIVRAEPIISDIIPSLEAGIKTGIAADIEKEKKRRGLLPGVRPEDVWPGHQTGGNVKKKTLDELFAEAEATKITYTPSTSKRVITDPVQARLNKEREEYEKQRQLGPAKTDQSYKTGPTLYQTLSLPNKQLEEGKKFVEESDRRLQENTKEKAKYKGLKGGIKAAGEIFDIGRRGINVAGHIMTMAPMEATGKITQKETVEFARRNQDFGIGDVGLSMAVPSSLGSGRVGRLANPLLKAGNVYGNLSNIFGLFRRRKRRKHYDSGSLVSGFGSGDKVPALLEPGEFVLNRNAVSTIGAGKLSSINKKYGRFKKGGPVKLQEGGQAVAGIDISLMDRVVQNFGTQIDKFVNAINSINGFSIQHTGTFEVTINHMGLGALSNMESAFGEFIRNLISKKVNEWLQNNSLSGPGMGLMGNQ